MTMRVRPAELVVALLVMTACASGGAVATTEPTTTGAPTTSDSATIAPSTTNVLNTDTAVVLETTAAKMFVTPGVPSDGVGEVT